MAYVAGDKFPIRPDDFKTNFDANNPDKVAAVQAAIAAEPKPVHIPRERPPAVVIDEGALVLVETRKDLRSLELPF